MTQNQIGGSQMVQDAKPGKRPKRVYRPVTVILTQELYQRLEQLSDIRGTHRVSVLIREMVVAELAKYELAAGVDNHLVDAATRLT